MKNSFFFVLVLFSGTVFASAGASSPIDRELESYIETFKLVPVERLEGAEPHLYRAGKLLFSDPVLSGNRNISCRDCHHPGKGTSDAVALSLGEGSISDDYFRKQSDGAVIRRHSPALYNLGRPEFTHMFWDGRVSYRSGIFSTPEDRLNGANPKAAHITNELKNALDAQVIFPMLSHEEMRGKPGTNEIADEKDDLKAWELLVARLKYERPIIVGALSKAFPGERLNIGHVARALGEFITYEFQVWDTPYDNYLRGDKKALDDKAKRGFKIFLTKGRCANCHWGKHLTNHAFQSAGVPSLKKTGAIEDRGREEITGNPRDRYTFKNPGLRNVALSAPYMHNGVYGDLKEVIDHYNALRKSLFFFQPSEELQIPYNSRLSVGSPQVSEEIYRTVFQPFLRRGLGLDEKESEDLEYFLRFGLTQQR